MEPSAADVLNLLLTAVRGLGIQTEPEMKFDDRVLAKTEKLAGTGPAEWRAWSFVMSGILAKVAPEFPQRLKEAIAMDKPIADNLVDPRLVKMSEILHYVLVLSTVQGSIAQTLLEQCPDNNGFEAWRRLHE